MNTTELTQEEMGALIAKLGGMANVQDILAGSKNVEVRNAYDPNTYPQKSFRVLFPDFEVKVDATILSGDRMSCNIATYAEGNPLDGMKVLSQEQEELGVIKGYSLTIPCLRFNEVPNFSIVNAKGQVAKLVEYFDPPLQLS